MSNTYINFNVKERVALENAMATAIPKSDVAWKKIKSKIFDNILINAYEKWFGVRTKDRTNRVWVVVNVVNYALNSPNITWKRVAGNPDFGAALMPNGGWDIQSVKQIINTKGYTVEIGDEFFKNGVDEQINTIIHEISHIVVNTEDEVYISPGKLGEKAYGKKLCKLLKDNDPDKAVNNAENYGYFHLEF